MAKLSPNFSPSEFTCEHCGEGTPKMALVELLEGIRFVATERYYPSKVKLTISGRLRCRTHNEALRADGIGAAKESRHIFPDYADAADIKVYQFDALEQQWLQVNPDEVAILAESVLQGSGCIIKYNGRTHVDTGSDGPTRPYRGDKR